MGDCLGFTGDCGDLQTQFADLQGPFTYSDGPGDAPTEHDSLADYVCHAFPDDAFVTDQFFVGLISVAVALPVDLLLVSMFEASNVGDAPKRWLDAPSGVWRLLLGKDCHRQWQYDSKSKPVSDLVKWLARRGEEALPGKVVRLLRWLWAKACRAPADGDPKADGGTDDSAYDDGASMDSEEARSEACSKRSYAFGGLLGVYVVWAAFSWVIFTYGMLIYKTLGDNAQKEFAKVRPLTSSQQGSQQALCVRFFAADALDLAQTWGVGYSLNNISEWQEVFKTAAKTALIIVVLDLLRVTKDRSWFEVRQGGAGCIQLVVTPSCGATGARGLHQHAGHAVQRRRERLVEPDAAARGAAEPPCGRLSDRNGLCALNGAWKCCWHVARPANALPPLAVAQPAEGDDDLLDL